MKGMMARVGEQLKALHRDERGVDMVEYILIVAAIALPLLGFVVYFWGEIKKWTLDLWGELTGKAKGQMEGN